MTIITKIKIIIRKPVSVRHGIHFENCLCREEK